MPDYTTFPPYVVYQKIRQKLETIDPGNGYNTRVHVGTHFVPPDAVEHLPFVCVEPAVLQGDVQIFEGGTGESFSEDADLSFVVWGYYEDEVDKEAAMWALLHDILNALWADESLGDTTAGTDLVRASWDLAELKDSSRGVLAVEMKARVLFARGG
jgi:hypothetical protein